MHIRPMQVLLLAHLCLYHSAITPQNARWQCGLFSTALVVPSFLLFTSFYPDLEKKEEHFFQMDQSHLLWSASTRRVVTLVHISVQPRSNIEA